MTGGGGAAMTQEDFVRLGFELIQQRRDGSLQYSRRVHPYLSYWLVAYSNGVGELTWELALGEYLRAKGLAVSAQDELSLFVFPPGEDRGPLEVSWLEEALARVERLLGSIDLRLGT